MIKITWDRNGYYTLYPKWEWDSCREIILRLAAKINLKPITIEEVGK